MPEIDLIVYPPKTKLKKVTLSFPNENPASV
jgi:hypothetical protein